MQAGTNHLIYSCFSSCYLRTIDTNAPYKCSLCYVQSGVPVHTLLLHSEDWSHHVQRGDENPQLSYQAGQQQSPGGLAVSLPVAKHLAHAQNRHVLVSLAEQMCHLNLPWRVLR